MSVTHRLINRVNSTLPQELAYHWLRVIEDSGNAACTSFNRALTIYEVYNQGLPGWACLYDSLPKKQKQLLKYSGVSV